jgi:hypothetical protein
MMILMMTMVHTFFPYIGTSILLDIDGGRDVKVYQVRVGVGTWKLY